jgi:hypothetical protein
MKYFFVCLFLMQQSAGAEIFTAGNYLAELKKVEAGKSRRSMEALYNKALELCDELSESLDSVDKVIIARSTAALRGIEIWNDGGYGAGLKYDFFLELAAGKGKKADKEFFSILMGEQRAGGLNVYTKSLSDLGVCNTIGSGAFVKFYGKWIAFRKKYPKNYAYAAQENAQNIEDALSGAVCVCGGREQALEELEMFMSKFPKTSARVDMADRAVLFHDNLPGVTFNCTASP